MKQKHHIWTLPLLTFFGSYIAMYVLTGSYALQAPSLIGKTVLEASQLLSANQCNLKIAGTKEDKDLPDGTVISQFPHAQHSVKSGQTFMCVISKKPLHEYMANLVGKFSDQIQQMFSTAAVRYKTFDIPHVAPQGMCIGQFPHVGKALENDTVIIYCSAGNHKPVIVPNFSGHTIAQLRDFFDDHGIVPQVTHTSGVSQFHSCHACTIVGQKPLAGSLVELKKPFTMQLYVQ